MLSKCLNPRCSATFQYLNQGRLFRIDFSEESKKLVSAGRQKTRSAKSKTSRLEHFWLCKECSQLMTIALNDLGEVRLIMLKPPARGPSSVPVPPKFESYEVNVS